MLLTMQEMVENDADNLFGMIHARYILTHQVYSYMYLFQRVERDGSMCWSW